MSTPISWAKEHEYPGLPRYLRVLYDWFFREQTKAYDNAVLPDGQWRLCLGCIVWGKYVDRFLKYCVPSLLAPGNVRALHDPLIIIHTDADSVNKITNGLGNLWHHARIEFHIIPDEILAIVPEDGANKYWLLGTALNIHMQQAKYRAHSYHMLMPDHIYAAWYFSNIDRLRFDGKQVIVQGALSAKMETLGPILEDRHGVVSADHLAALAVDHMHPQIKPFLMNGKEDVFPRGLLLVMIGAKATHIISPHISIVYMSHELLMRMSPRVFNTTDAQLPYFIPEDVEPYMPDAKDGMAYCEISDVDKTLSWDHGVSKLEFCARFWIAAYCCRGFERFFGLTTIQPYPHGYAPPIEPMTDEEIENFKAHIRGYISEYYEALYLTVPEEFRGDPLEKLTAKWLAEQAA